MNEIPDTYLLTNDEQLPDDPREQLRELPEDGPGFQRITVPNHGRRQDTEIPPGEYVVFNGELFISIRGLGDPLDISAMFGRNHPRPSYEAYVASLKPRRKSRIWRPTKAPPPLPPPRSTLIIRTRTTAGEVYWRLSAYANDRRVTADNEVVKDTYVTTESDIEVVGSGFAAVGRYALPTPFPAVYAYAVRPTPGTEIELGTVRPNFGQAGGGVEGVFLAPSGLWTVANHKRVLPAW